MATCVRLIPYIMIMIMILIIAVTYTSTTSPVLPDEQPKSKSPYNLSSLLNSLGFHDFSVAASSSNSTVTIFSPTDVSLRSCPYCNPPLLFLEHAVPGLYPFRVLSTFAFGTKIQTLASTPTAPLCLTLTKSNSTTDPTLFVGGVEITRPDLFNDGKFIIHGIQGYLAHLSPFSCQIERMTSLSFPSYTTSTMPMPMRGLLKEAMFRLRISKYTVLSLLIQQNLDLLSQLNSMTIFANDDVGVFGEGHIFVSNFRFHIVPNRRLTALELISLPADSVLPTMLTGESLVVTAAGGGGSLSPMRINNVRVTRTNIVCNQGIAVHGVASPLVRVHRTPGPMRMRWWPEPDQTEGGPSSFRY